LHPGLCDCCDYWTVSDAVVECETVPLLPVIVSENVPRCEFRAVVTLRTDEPEPATLAGANDEVAFLGNPVTLSATDPVNPFKDPTVTVYVVDPPRGTVAEIGVTATVKSGGAGVVTVRVTVVECVAAVPVPVTVIVYVPPGVVALVAMLKVELPPLEIEAGVKVAVAPAGRPVADRVTACETPFVIAVEMVTSGAVFPCSTVTDVGLAPMEKSSAGGGCALTQFGSVKEPMRVRQLKVPFAGSYSLVNQKVQSSTGSTASIE